MDGGINGEMKVKLHIGDVKVGVDKAALDSRIHKVADGSKDR